MDEGLHWPSQHVREHTRDAWILRRLARQYDASDRSGFRFFQHLYATADFKTYALQIGSADVGGIVLEGKAVDDATQGRVPQHALFAGSQIGREAYASRARRRAQSSRFELLARPVQ